MVRITKVGGLYAAEALEWISNRRLTFPPMTRSELICALEREGIHQTDIGDAFYAADPDWLGDIPTIDERAREQIRELGRARNVSVHRLVPGGAVPREMFLVVPALDKDASLWLPHSQACIEMSSAIHEVIPDRAQEPRVELYEGHWLKQSTEPV